MGNLLVVFQIGYQGAKGEARVHPGAHGQRGPQHGGNGVPDIGQIGGHGHDGGGVVPRLAGGGAVLLVEGLEPGLGLLLVVKGLDHLHALDHLLDIAVYRAQGGLLLGEIFPAALAEHGEHSHDRAQHDQGGQEQQGGQGDHHGHHAHKGDHAGDQLHHRLLQRHLHVVRVVGEAAHQFAVGVGVKVAQGQLLELVEQLLSHPVAALLGQLGHQVGLDVGTRRRQQIDPHEPQAAGRQTGPVGLPRGPGAGDPVDDGLLQIGARHPKQGGRHHADQRGDEQGGPVGDILHGAQHGAAQILGLSEAAPGSAGAVGRAAGPFVFTHLCRPLPAGNRKFRGRSCWFSSAHRGCPRRSRCHRPAPRFCRRTAPS